MPFSLHNCAAVVLRRQSTGVRGIPRGCRPIEDNAQHLASGLNDILNGVSTSIRKMAIADMSFWSAACTRGNSRIRCGSSPPKVPARISIHGAVEARTVGHPSHGPGKAPTPDLGARHPQTALTQRSFSHRSQRSQNVHQLSLLDATHDRCEAFVELSVIVAQDLDLCQQQLEESGHQNNLPRRPCRCNQWRVLPA